MNRLAIIVEGGTEQTFVRNQLAPHLSTLGIQAWAVLPGRRGRLQGVRKWPGASQDILRLLRDGTYVTTMFDYYALPNDWPGRQDASELSCPDRGAFIQTQIHKAITDKMGNDFDSRKFIPYIQLHEFEALAFSDVATLASVTQPLTYYSIETLADHFAKIVESCGGPEAINDGYDTCPSRRIDSRVKAYKKAVHGPIITGRIGLDGIRKKCPHFANWISSLEGISRDWF